MTDNEIIKVLNEADGTNEVGIYCADCEGEYIAIVKASDVVDLINRQKAEIERLKSLERNVYETVEKLKNKIESEARKEFVKRLKERNRGKISVCVGWVDFDDIDNLLKEMEKDK